jgi:hypothetical protein
MKIAIVGADGTNKAWTPEREEKAKIIIKSILEIPIKSKGLVGHNYRWTAMGFPSWFDVKPLPDEDVEIVSVSGRCPVGEKRWYCLSCHGFINQETHNTNIRNLGHEMIEVYDKGGIDTIAEIVASELGIQKEIYPAEVNQWKDKYLPYAKRFQRITGRNYAIGFRSRNIKIAESCDILYDIEPKGSCKHCSGRGFTSKHPNFLLYGRRCRFCHGTGVYSGGTWTLNYAKKLGKEVHQVVVE